MLNKKILLMLAACILLSSCAQNSKPDSKTEPPEDAISSPVTVAPDPFTPETNTSSSEGNQNTSSVNQPVNEEQANSEEPQILYHVNKAYDIVPNEEGTNKKVVLLTFDDGPKDKDMIVSMLDTLDKHQAKAIFFVNGYRVQANPELLKLIHERGQTIGNHSWDHIDLKKESEQSARKQIEDVQQIVKELTGTAPAFIRPPFGSGNEVTRIIARDNDLIYMTWSNGSLDWDSKSKNKPEAVIQNVMDQLHPGSNILMHELPWTVEALDELLTILKDKGYSFADPRSIGIPPESPGK